MDEQTKILLLFFLFWRAQKGEGNLPSLGCPSSRRVFNTKQPQTQSKASFHTLRPSAHTMHAGQSRTYSTENADRKQLCLTAEISACVHVCVCVRQSVSLSSPSGVIKARTNHPERSPILMHSSFLSTFLPLPLWYINTIKFSTENLLERPPHAGQSATANQSVLFRSNESQLSPSRALNPGRPCATLGRDKSGMAGQHGASLHGRRAHMCTSTRAPMQQITTALPSSQTNSVHRIYLWQSLNCHVHKQAHTPQRSTSVQLCTCTVSRPVKQISASW